MTPMEPSSFQPAAGYTKLNRLNLSKNKATFLQWALLRSDIMLLCRRRS